MQTSLLDEVQLAPKYCILKAFPSILVWRDPWFRQIAGSFLHAIYVLHRAHYSKEYCLCSSLKAFSYWNYSISYYGIQFIRVPDVVEELGNVLELLEGTRIGWESLDSHNIGIFASLLLPLPVLINNLSVTIAERRRTASSCTLQ